jgi:hypothetical protein
MLKENAVVKDAVVAMQSAIETGDREKITAAFENFGESIANTVREEFESANGDNDVLLQRGFRVLTSTEQKFYEKVIEAGKQKTVQAMNGLLTPEVMPNTIIEDVYRDLTEEHPLLDKINFVSVQYLTRWILNDHTADCAVWGDVNEEITKEITSAFRTIEMTQCKLSAFAVIDKDMLELGPVFLDAYIRTYLKEALAKALEKSIICGNGHKSPIGMDRDIHEGVNVNTSTGYPQKTAVKLTSFMPAEYGKVLAQLAKTEKEHNRVFDQVTLICNMQDYLSKVMPATTVLTAVGSYATNLFPFPTEVVRSAELETGKAILVLPEEYFMGLGTSKEGTLEFSDEFKFLEDQRVFKIKLHGMGRAYDNTVAILLDISKLKPAYVQVEGTPDTTE